MAASDCGLEFRSLLSLPHPPGNLREHVAHLASKWSPRAQRDIGSAELAGAVDRGALVWVVGGAARPCVTVLPPRAVHIAGRFIASTRSSPALRKRQTPGLSCDVHPCIFPRFRHLTPCEAACLTQRRMHEPVVTIDQFPFLALRR